MREMTAVILAAGQGTRMRSTLPKVLHPILGRPLIHFPVSLAKSVGCKTIVTVVGHGREAVMAAVTDTFGKGAVFAHQKEQLGTGHAVMTAIAKLRGQTGAVLILSGDVPLLDKRSVTRLKRAYNGRLAMLSFRPDDPTGYGRVIRENDKLVAIREHRDCSAAERGVNECNAGVYLIDIAFLRKSIKRLKSDNDQNELYLTDLVAMADEEGGAVAVEVSAEVVSGINDRAELAAAEATLSRNRNRELMQSGVTMIAPETIRVEMGVSVGPDTTLHANVQLSGTTRVGSGCVIGQGSIISDTLIEDDVIVKPYSVIEQSLVMHGAQVGPMARLRPGAEIGPEAKIGNWVEIKNSKIGKGSKAGHLAYLGDGVVGDGVNIGAGTIFCNYDGFLKHKTVIEDGVFIGSDSQLVAPVTIGEGAYVASGSTITADVPGEALALSRVRQRNIPKRAAILKKRLMAEKQRRLAAAAKSGAKRKRK